VAAGLVLSMVLCAMNSYLTLSFGVIEEGPTIAALFFFAFFVVIRLAYGKLRPVTTTELVIVASMGSAGGSFGFIANFYAAREMVALTTHHGAAYTVVQMIGFGIVSSMVGLAIAIPLRELLVIREKLPWPGARAVESVIDSLVQKGDGKQPMILLGVFAVAIAYVICNNEDGYGLVPAEIALGGLAAYGGALSLAPFAIGSSYLLGFRTCVGFLFGAGILMLMGRFLPGHLPADEFSPDAPHRFVWPGIGFLTASGLTLIVLNYKVMLGSLGGLFKLGDTGDAGDRVLSPRGFAIFGAVAIVAAIVGLVVLFDIPILVVLMLIAIGGLIQNVISTRAQAQTNFNPARVMGILMQGVAWLAGGHSAGINLAGAGFVAGSGAQASMMSQDMAYGRAFRVPPRWQFVTQCVTVVPCAIAAALVYQWIARQHPMTLQSHLAAPVAKVWAASAMIFDGSTPMPTGAVTGLVIGGIVGALYTAIERIPGVERWIPCSVGLGIGLVLPAAYGIAFFVGGFIQWIVLGRWMRWTPATLTTISVACVVAEGIGGVVKAFLQQLGMI
jgi:uncharacterized oligopeptide transporter (OPT) family protein